MSREHPTWYGNVIRSYAAWLIAVAMALAAAWPFWHDWQTNPGVDAVASFVWSIVVFLAVGIVAGVVMNRVFSLPYASSLATLGFGLALVILVADLRLVWWLLAVAPGIGAAVAAIPEASGNICERICLWTYGFLLIGLVVIFLVWA
ncbi:hypothetical protein ACIRON_16240 [Nocardioides sp. NPDC101246]|uniref:hypothetical protein n=1 Tax=Nocardioides sp. NPDC101246 TaxID=3364336 RepID=UPI0038226CCF